MKKQLLLLAVTFLFVFRASGQGEIPVDMFTGTPTIQIPIWSVSDHDLAQPLEMVYSAGGVRLDEPSGVFGLGWNLSASGSITRMVKGLPDDFTGTASDLRRGWLYKNASNVGIASDVNSLTDGADTSPSTCTDEVAAYNKINGWNYKIDSEPDVFAYSFGALSGKFVFDNLDPCGVRMIPFRDIKIEPIPVSGTDKKIASFKITTNDGVIFTFDQIVTATRWTEKITGVTSVEFQKRDFEFYDLSQYSTKAIYTTEWKLSRVDSPSGAFLTYNYASESTQSRDTLRVGIRSTSSSAIIAKDIYINKIDSYKRNLTSITGSSGGSVSLDYNTNGMLNSVSVFDSRRTGASLVKTFALGYTAVRAPGSSYYRYFLKSIQESSGSCDVIPPHKFTYVGVDMDVDRGQTQRCMLPSPYSKSKDFWGFYNGKSNTSRFATLYLYPGHTSPSERYRLYPIPGYAGQSFILTGADRTPSNLNSQIGTLETVSYPWGGSTRIDYEANSYYDEAGLQTLIGGGLRISKVVYFDGVNTNSKIIKTFNYDETVGKSSGRLLSRPSFAIPTWEYRDPVAGTVKSYLTLSAGVAQDMWEHLTVRSEDDLSSGATAHGSSVGYKVVTVKRPGSGSAKFEYTLPCAYGETAIGDWSPTVDKFVRSSNCPTMGIVSAGGAFFYPYTTDANYDYERGLLSKKTECNESGAKIREITNTYQNLVKVGTTPYPVWGVAYDKYANSVDPAYFYGKYFYLTDIDKVLLSESVVVYDSSTTAKNITALSEYFYASTNHKLLTSVRTTNSDGTVYTSKMKYPLDYGTLPANIDKPLEMIKKLQTDFRNGTVIEQVSTILKSGESEKVIGASVIELNDFGTTKALLQYSLSFSSNVGVTNFVNSDKFLQGATYIFKPDSRYEITNTILAYDSYQKPLSAVGQGRMPMSTHWGHKKTLPVVTGKNVMHNQFAYSNFETIPNDPIQGTGYEFQTDQTIVGTGRTGQNATHPIVKLTRTVDKSTSTQNYILSFWLKKQSAAVDFLVTIKNTALTTTYYSNTFAVNPTGTDFEYFEKIIPVASAPSTFVIQLQGQSLDGPNIISSPGLLPVMDDVCFYPDNAELTTFSYTIPFGANAVTNTQGISSFKQYDNLGRVKYIFDQDKNIIQKNSPQFTSIAAPTLIADFALPSTLVDNTSLTFAAEGNCLDGVTTYQWNFGGTILNGQSVNYTYNSPGLKSVTLTVSHPAYQNPLTITRNFTLTMGDFNATICAKGVTENNECTGPAYTATCSNITTTPAASSAIFRAITFTNLPAGETVASYQWKKRSYSASTWTNGATTQEYTITKIFELTESVDIRCEVTSNTGRKAYSNIMAIIITPCN